jgi:hypothetical protein
VYRNLLIRVSKNYSGGIFMPEKDQKQRSKYWLLVLNKLKEKGV